MSAIAVSIFYQWDQRDHIRLSVELTFHTAIGTRTSPDPVHTCTFARVEHYHNESGITRNAYYVIPFNVIDALAGVDFGP